jgi:hypothetical protein
LGRVGSRWSDPATRSALREQIPIAVSELSDQYLIRSVMWASSSLTAKAASLNRGRLITARIPFDNARPPPIVSEIKTRPAQGGLRRILAGSAWTHRWREMDSNHWSRSEKGLASSRPPRSTSGPFTSTGSNLPRQRDRIAALAIWECRGDAERTVDCRQVLG